MPVNATTEDAAELTPAKLATLIRALQPRPACFDDRLLAADRKTAA